MVQWFEARVWQIATSVLGAAALALLITTVVVSFQKAGLERDLAKAEATIERSATDLTQARRNVTALETSIKESNAEIERVSLAGAERLRAAEAAVAAAREQNLALRGRVDRLLAATPTGSGCDRVNEMNQAVQEAFR